jgi:hypothetical protein
MAVDDRFSIGVQAPAKKKATSDMDSEDGDFLDEKPKKKPAAKKPKKASFP